MSSNPDPWAVRELDGGLGLELQAGEDPALVLAEGKNRVRVELDQVKAVLGALVDAAADPAEVLVQMETTDERYYEAEIHRLKGEILLMQADEAGAEADVHQAERCFQHAIEVVRRQRAKSWELRATVSLCRLWQKQGMVDEDGGCLPTFTVGSPKGLTHPICKRPGRCSKRCRRVLQNGRTAIAPARELTTRPISNPPDGRCILPIPGLY